MKRLKGISLKSLILIMFIVLFIGCEELAIKDNHVENNRTTKTSKEESKHSKSPPQNESVEVHTDTEYLGVELIMEKLNADEEFKPSKDFIVVFHGYHSLEKKLQPYHRHFTTPEGEVLPISVYTTGTYQVNQNIEVIVSIIQDKTFENGGYIFYSDKENLKNLENYSIFKYKKSYVVFEFKYISEPVETSEYTFDFIDKFFEKYKEVYVTYFASLEDW